MVKENTGKSKQGKRMHPVGEASTCTQQSGARWKQRQVPRAARERARQKKRTLSLTEFMAKMNKDEAEVKTFHFLWFSRPFSRTMANAHACTDVPMQRCWEGNKKKTLVRRLHTCGSLALKLDVCDRTGAHKNNKKQEQVVRETA